MKLMKKNWISIKVLNGRKIKSDSTGGIPSTVSRLNKLSENLKDGESIWYVAFPACSQYIIIIAESEKAAKDMFEKAYDKKPEFNVCMVFKADEWIKYKDDYPLEPLALLQ